ncbi:hypothetical protein LSTR_LSTR003854 [Laodelphax striatellus]|uniref:Uncharacterized protein n=1 Tax=Laodelphax striatellus TaxID=195883 RepID=A0A482XE95_LAOST|nr:hypothetical protein LSTR_LSTR003854 [Laodelphax striatellus]
MIGLCVKNSTQSSEAKRSKLKMDYLFFTSIWLLLAYASFFLALSPIVVVALALKPELPALVLRRVYSIPIEAV